MKRRLSKSARVGVLGALAAAAILVALANAGSASAGTSGSGSYTTHASYTSASGGKGGGADGGYGGKVVITGDKTCASGGNGGGYEAGKGGTYGDGCKTSTAPSSSYSKPSSSVPVSSSSSVPISSSSAPPSSSSASSTAPVLPLITSALQCGKITYTVVNSGSKDLYYRVVDVPADTVPFSEAGKFTAPHGTTVFVFTLVTATRSLPAADSVYLFEGLSTTVHSDAVAWDCTVSSSASTSIAPAAAVVNPEQPVTDASASLPNTGAKGLPGLLVSIFTLLSLGGGVLFGARKWRVSRQH